MTWAHAPWTTALCQSMVDSWWHRDKSSPKLSPQDATASESSPMVGKIQERGGGGCRSYPGSLQTLSAGPVLGPVMTRPLYVGHKAVRLSLLVISFGGARLIRLTRLLLLLLLGIYTIEGHLLGQCVLVGNGQIS
jgi:hypothetical protein